MSHLDPPCIRELKISALARWCTSMILICSIEALNALQCFDTEVHRHDQYWSILWCWNINVQEFCSINILVKYEGEGYSGTYTSIGWNLTIFNQCILRILIKVSTNHKFLPTNVKNPNVLVNLILQFEPIKIGRNFLNSQNCLGKVLNLSWNIVQYSKRIFYQKKSFIRNIWKF